MRIAEVFQSIQGEGFLTGTPSVFVRASGCSLRCAFCDTPYASWEPEGDDWSVEAIVARVVELQERHVVLTGGEPMLFADLVPLSQELGRLGLHVTIETAGTHFLPVRCDLMSVSPKLSNSDPAGGRCQVEYRDRAPHMPPATYHLLERHRQQRHAPDVIHRLAAEYSCQFKFVVDSPDTCREVEQYLVEFPEIDRLRVMLMPQAADRESLARQAQWLEPYCASHGLHYCPRKHIDWFGPARGK